MFLRRVLTSNPGRRLFNSYKTVNVNKEATDKDSDTLWETIASSQIKTPTDWQQVRSKVLENSANSGPRSRSMIKSHNVDAMTLGICISKNQYDLAFSYFDFLQSEKSGPNLAAIGKYFQLLYQKNCDCEEVAEDDHKRIIDMFNKIRKRYPVLDIYTLEKATLALSVTKEWRKCLDLLKEAKIMATPSALSYSAVVAAAFSNNDESLAWKLIQELLENNKVPFGVAYRSYFKKNCQSAKEIEKLLYFMHEHHLKFSDGFARELVKYNKTSKVMQSHLRKVTDKGQCIHCKSQLDLFDLSDAEFKELKQNVLDNVIVGKDVFNKSSPEELQRFKDFVSGMEEFDVVIDGLNVAYSAGVKQSPATTSALVATVVDHFVQSKKKVLVLGRSHMERWPRHNWDYVKKNSTVFLTQDLSQDDPYLLYCALHSGKNTIVVTRDLMRGHKFLLHNLRLKLLFEKWLMQRQYHLLYADIKSRKSTFKVPLGYSDLAQKNGKYWHVPFELPLRSNTNNNLGWICLHLKS